jgi:hypothetical protein
VLVAGFAFVCAAVDGGVRRKEVSGDRISVAILAMQEAWEDVHGVQADDGQISWYDLDAEPPALLELMALGLWDETPPHVQVLLGPAIRALQENVVWHNVVVAKGRDHGYRVLVGAPMFVLVLAEHLCELGHHIFVLLHDLLGRSWQRIVVVVPCGVARPYDKVDVVLDVVVNPLERLVDERIGRVAARRLCAVHACGPALAMACCLLRGAGIRLVVGVGVEICTTRSVPRLHG